MRIKISNLSGYGGVVWFCIQNSSFLGACSFLTSTYSTCLIDNSRSGSGSGSGSGPGLQYKCGAPLFTSGPILFCPFRRWQLAVYQAVWQWWMRNRCHLDRWGSFQNPKNRMIFSIISLKKHHSRCSCIRYTHECECGCEFSLIFESHRLAESGFETEV